MLTLQSFLLSLVLVVIVNFDLLLVPVFVSLLDKFELDESSGLLLTRSDLKCEVLLWFALPCFFFRRQATQVALLVDPFAPQLLLLETERRLHGGLRVPLMATLVVSCDQVLLEVVLRREKHWTHVRPVLRRLDGVQGVHRVLIPGQVSLAQLHLQLRHRLVEQLLRLAHFIEVQLLNL